MLFPHIMVYLVDHVNTLKRESPYD
jgi:hypothetical protein